MSDSKDDNKFVKVNKPCKDGRKFFYKSKPKDKQDTFMKIVHSTLD